MARPKGPLYEEGALPLRRGWADEGIGPYMLRYKIKKSRCFRSGSCFLIQCPSR